MSDVEQIMGLVQAENIQVHAESYDVALDMSFPKGTFFVFRLVQDLMARPCFCGKVA